MARYLNDHEHDVYEVVDFWLRKRGHHAAIAVANSELDDDDPAKITRDMVELLREVNAKLTDRQRHWTAILELDRIADVLESYLPPSPSEAA